MKRIANSIVSNQEVLLSVLLTILMVAVIAKNPSLLHVQTLFSIIRYSMIDVIFALAVMIILVAGGIDVSFLAIGISAAYTTVKLVPASGGPQYVFVAFAIATAIGVVLGSINALIVLRVKVSTLIATLASSAMFVGALALAAGSEKIPAMPDYLAILSDTNILTFPGIGRGTTKLNIVFLAVVAILVIISLTMRYTVFGKSIYALGGDEQGAFRAGVKVAKTRWAIFAAAGGMCGIAGLMHVTLAGEADPATFIGRELDVLAAVVLGGALITGGKGTVRGTILGVLTIAVIKQSLIPLGIPPTWEKAVVGALLLVGIALQAVSARQRKRRSILEPEAVKERT